VHPLVILSGLAHKILNCLQNLDESLYSELEPGPLACFLRIFGSSNSYAHHCKAGGSRARESALCSNLKYCKHSGTGGHSVAPGWKLERGFTLTSHGCRAVERWVYFSAPHCWMGLHMAYLGGSGTEMFAWAGAPTWLASASDSERVIKFGPGHLSN